MKINNKSFSAHLLTVMFLLTCQALSNTAAADYKGYWADNVHDYQSANAARTPATYPEIRGYEPAYPAGSDNDYRAAASYYAPALQYSTYQGEE